MAPAPARRNQQVLLQMPRKPLQDRMRPALHVHRLGLARMEALEGSRIAIIFNGSPLSNGDCGSGESEIRRWILENDWLDAIVMLPDQMFYNTGIFTYIWLLRNDKPASHRGRVMLIDARQQFEKEPKAFASKRNRMTDAHRAWVEKRFFDGWARNYADDQVKIFRREDFAYHKVSVVFWQTDENDKPAIVTELYEKSFTAATVAKEQDFYCREAPSAAPKGQNHTSPGQSESASVALGKPPHPFLSPVSGATLDLGHAQHLPN